eukprot:11998927-Heterocapsa_arctica.AAC.1
MTEREDTSRGAASNQQQLTWAQQSALRDRIAEHNLQFSHRGRQRPHIWLPPIIRGGGRPPVPQPNQ